jgi:DMSO reductase anchor subunit
MLSAWGVKLAWWRLAGMAKHAGSIESATGLGALGAVRPLMPPHTEENYLQHEMGFVVARRHADKLRMIALLLGGGLPVLILVLAPASAGALAVAVLAHVAGMFVERWLFFAEAKHVVTLYYGETA